MASPIRKEVTIGGCRLILGDCREVLPLIGKVDAVVTDPPYGIINEFGSQKRKDGSRTLQFSWDGPQINELVFDSLDLAGNISDSFFCFCGVSQVSHIESRLNDRFTVKPAVWVKACPPPAMPGNWWPSGFEFALYGYKPGATFLDVDTKRSNVFYSDTYRAGIRAFEKVAHPTQKWLPLMERVVRSVATPRGLVLDLFMGSGTTGVACVMQGRSFIGMEINEAYFDIACDRIRKAYDQPDMFVAPRPAAPVQQSIFDGAA